MHMKKVNENKSSGAEVLMAWGSINLGVYSQG